MECYFKLPFIQIQQTAYTELTGSGSEIELDWAIVCMWPLAIISQLECM